MKKSEEISNFPDTDKRICVKLNLGGVEKRSNRNEKGGGTRYYIRKKGQFIYGQQNFHKGAFGIIPDSLDGFESSNDLPTFDIDETICDVRYLYYFFAGFYTELEKIAKGIGSKRIYPEQIYQLEINLPSLTKQKLIINKIENLKYQELQHAEKINESMCLIKSLRQSILSDAIQGKLVPQDPTDEPASELLKKIHAEKEQLIAEKKIKRPKPLAPIRDDEKPFVLPKGWEWVRLGDVCVKITDGTHHSPENLISGDYKYITAKNIKNSGVILSNLSYVNSDVHKEIYSRCNPELGDILYIKDGATTGIVTINNLNEEFSMLSSVALLKLPTVIINKYLLCCMRSSYYYERTRGDMSGVAITRVTLTKIENSLIPLPSLKEQQHIVAKVDELMQLCDQLEARVTDAQQQGKLFMESVLQSVFR